MKRSLYIHRSGLAMVVLNHGGHATLFEVYLLYSSDFDAYETDPADERGRDTVRGRVLGLPMDGESLSAALEYRRHEILDQWEGHPEWMASDLMEDDWVRTELPECPEEDEADEDDEDYLPDEVARMRTQHAGRVHEIDIYLPDGLPGHSP